MGENQSVVFILTPTINTQHSVPNFPVLRQLNVLFTSEERMLTEKLKNESLDILNSKSCFNIKSIKSCFSVSIIKLMKDKWCICQVALLCVHLSWLEKAKKKFFFKKKKSVLSLGPNTKGTLLSCWPTLNFSSLSQELLGCAIKRCQESQPGKVECPQMPYIAYKYKWKMLKIIQKQERPFAKCFWFIAGYCADLYQLFSLHFIQKYCKLWVGMLLHTGGKALINSK